MNNKSLKQIGYTKSVKNLVIHQARLANKANLDALVCSAHEVKFVKRIEGRIIDIFTLRSKLTKLKIKRNWDRKDWWISAEEAVDLKLVDEIRATMTEHVNNKKKRKKR